MIQFFVEGTPVSQGSKTAWVPTARNADVDEAISQLRSDAVMLTEGDDVSLDDGREGDRLFALADRLAATGNWPIFIPSKTGGRGRWLANLRESSDKYLKPWRKAIAAAAREAYDGEPYRGAVTAEIDFWFRRPLSHYGTGRNAEKLKPHAPPRHTQKPDVDKLLRAVLDGITGVVIHDDSQVDDVHPVKRWCDRRDEPEGCEVRIYFEGDE